MVSNSDVSLFVVAINEKRSSDRAADAACMTRESFWSTSVYRRRVSESRPSSLRLERRPSIKVGDVSKEFFGAERALVSELLSSNRIAVRLTDSAFS